MGYHLVVVGMEAKYYNSATYDDLLIVKTRISELQSRGLTFHYMIYRDKTLLVEGTTKHLCVNTNKKPVVIPPRLFNILRDAKTK
jgi:acyl-CoA thioester hydrolase